MEEAIECDDGVPVWSHNGIVRTGETYKNVVKLTFAQGAGLPDPSRLFNSSLEGSTRRAIDLHEGEQIDSAAFKALVKAAVAENRKPSRPSRFLGRVALGKRWPGRQQVETLRCRSGTGLPF